MLAFAIDNPPPATIVLISGDKDFVYALGVLRNRRYNIVLVVPSRGAPIILRSQANTILEWYHIFHSLSLHTDVIPLIKLIFANAVDGIGDMTF